MGQRVVAAEISPRVARIVVLETTLRRTDVAEVKTIALPEGADRRQVLDLVRDAIDERIDSLVIAADPRTVSSRFLRFPFGDLRKLEAAVAFELEGQVPYALEDTALTWHVVSRSASSMEVIAALTPRKGLVELIADAEAAGLEPRAVVPAAASLAELAPHRDPASIAIAALGETTTHLAVVRNGELRLARTLRAGGADLDRTLARVFGVELAAAKEAKEAEVRVLGDEQAAAADERSRKISEAAAQGLAPLVTGLATSFKSLGPGDAPVRLLVTGGLSRLPGISQHLAQRLGIEVELVDLAAATASAGEAPALAALDRLLERRKAAAAEAAPVPSGPVVPPEHALALGLAISLVRHGRGAPLSFRRGELAYQGDLQLYRGQITRIAVGVAAVILLAIGGSIVRYSMISAEERRLDAAFCATGQKIIGREVCDPTALLSILRQSPGAGEGVVIPPYSAASLLEMLSRRIGTDVDVTFEELELRVDGRVGEPDRVTGKGEAGSFETTEQLAQSLRRDACVKEVEIPKQRKGREGNRVEFNVAVQVMCPGGSLPGQRALEEPQAAVPSGLGAEGEQR